MKLRSMAAAVVMLGLSLSASASVAYENGTDGGFWGGNNPFTYSMVFQPFTLDAGTTANSLTYNAFTTDATVPVTDVEVAFYDAGWNLVFDGHLGVAAQHVVGGTGGYDFTDYTVILPGVSLAAGSYELGLKVSPTQWDQHWSIVGDGHPGTNATDGFSHYFRIETAPIPEPETWALMLAGLAAMGFIARRRDEH